MDFTNLKELRDEYISQLKTLMFENGVLTPSITIFGTPNDEPEKGAIIHIPIPDKYMRSADDKDEFVDEVIPQIAIKVKEKFKLLGVAWSSEVWVKVAKKDEFNPEKDNIDDLPVRKEAVIVSIETAEDTECLIYDIKRHGKVVNKDGELVDDIELTIDDEMSSKSKGGNMGGRFVGLYKKFDI